jgi:hypothetical protein
MEVIPAEMPPIFTSAETMMVPVQTCVAAASCSAEVSEDNIALPPSSKSLADPPYAQQTIVTHLSSKSLPQVTVIGCPPVMATSGSSETTIQVHTSEASSVSGGQRVSLVTSKSHPNQISIVPIDQLQQLVTKAGIEPVASANVVVVVGDENSINEANRPPTINSSHQNTKTSASCGTLKDGCISVAVARSSPPKRRRKSAAASSILNDAAATDEDVDAKAAAANLPEKEGYKIELKKDSNGLGITIAGYVCEKGTLTRSSPPN